ncbi:MAG: hypothetical protein ACREQZ_07270 [Woeseiaceae bacterium]
MFRTFNLGIVLGLAGIAAVLHFVPVVDVHREPSHVEVLTNGGNAETFRIGLPHDRIMVGMQGLAETLPEDLRWPDHPSLSGFQAELFKIRDSQDTVIGMGGRVVSDGRRGEPFVQWILHLPARGTMVASFGADGGSGREGRLSAGTREFAMLSGRVTERFIAGDADDEASDGRIELRAALVGRLEEDE